MLVPQVQVTSKYKHVRFKKRRRENNKEKKTATDRTRAEDLKSKNCLGYSFHLLYTLNVFGQGNCVLVHFSEPPAYNKWRAFSEACFFNFYSGHSRTDWPSGVADLWACVTSAALIGRKNPGSFCLAILI